MPEASASGRVELVADRKWEVEHYKGNTDIAIEDAEPRHTVYIFKCEDSLVQVGRNMWDGRHIALGMMHQQ